MYSNDIKRFRDFGFKSKGTIYPYQQNTNQALVEAIHHNQSRAIIHFFGPLHQEIQDIDLKTYVIEKSMVMQYERTESFYRLCGLRDDTWFEIVPDTEYPEFVIEYKNNVKTLHSCRAEGIRMMTPTGVLVVRPKENFIKIEDMHNPEIIREMGQLCESNRRSTIHHIPFGVQYFYSKKDDALFFVRKKDIHVTEECGKSASVENCGPKSAFLENYGPYLIDSRGEHVMLSSIELFEVFSPEQRKREQFEMIRGELIEKSHEPSRVFNWCYDEEDRSRISRVFII